MVTYDQLAGWAGGHVTRADPAVVSSWRIPESMKVLLVEVGVPVTPRVIEEVAFQGEAEPVLETSSGTALYHLTNHSDRDFPAEQPSSFGVEPGSGVVYFVMPTGEAWFANTSIELWLRTLHCYGRHVTASQLLSEPDEPDQCLSEDDEERALAELAGLAERLKDIDPASFEGYIGFIWPEHLDRWLC
ncbi:SUKH-4 family immunity protein [Streptomyces sp. NPDC005181]|uniref:SUKH-4 family immunity protein n=1 Tax=Streptomyces sp. NPDC005181 TaxID=3156869 RepID=UPI0033A2CEE3